jgi:hypothetical protein
MRSHATQDRLQYVVIGDVLPEDLGALSDLLYT